MEFNLKLSEILNSIKEDQFVAIKNKLSKLNLTFPNVKKSDLVKSYRNKDFKIDFLTAYLLSIH
jgi:hypothetical protein